MSSTTRILAYRCAPSSPAEQQLQALGFAVTGTQSRDVLEDFLDGAEWSLLLLDLDTVPAALDYVAFWDAEPSRPPVVVTTRHASLDAAVRAMRVGCLDLIVEPISGAERIARIEDALRRSAQRRADKRAAEERSAAPRSDITGTFRCPRAPARTAVERGLSDRELEVAELLARGHRTQEIAARLFISPHTVRNHTRAIYRKLDVHSHVELIQMLAMTG